MNVLIQLMVVIRIPPVHIQLALIHANVIRGLMGNEQVVLLCKLYMHMHVSVHVHV